MSAATVSRALLAAVGAFSVACASPKAADPAKPPPPPAPVAPAADPGGPLAPLTASERVLAGELRADVERLAGEIGERHLGESWALASATDHLALELEKLGYEARRQGFAVGEAVAQNVEVVVPGGRRGRELIVVGAHYDTHAGTPGADDNASGVATVLALARALREHRPSRSIRLVLFANEEQPYFKTDQMGSLVYAKKLMGGGQEVIAMLNLESVGYYSDAPGSQRYPAPLADRFPDVGNFLAVVGNARSRAVHARVLKLLKAESSLPVEGAVLDETVEGVGDSDHWAFWKVGMPAVMLTDTAPFRNPNYHRPGDVPDTLDYERMARAVSGILRTLVALALTDPVDAGAAGGVDAGRSPIGG